MSVVGFISLLFLTGILRLAELHLSRRNQVRLMAQGAAQISDPHFPWMVLIHVGVLAGAAVEVVVLKRPFIPALAVAMCSLFLLANVVRWWVIRTLKTRWTVRVMDTARVGVVTDGPFRFVRHPNYAAVFIELLALPLIHTAWLTALAGSAAHAWILAQRVAVEEPALMANRVYREEMARKPRFLPGLF